MSAAPTSQPAQGLALSYLTSPSEATIRHMEQGDVVQQTSADMAAKAQIYSPDRYREPPPPPPTFLDRHWKKLLALLLLLAVVGVGVGVPVALLTASSRSSTTPSKSAVDGNVAGNAQTAPVITNATSNATTSTAAPTIIGGVGVTTNAQSSVCDPSIEACGIVAIQPATAYANLSFSIQSDSSMEGFNPQVYTNPHSAGLQYTQTYIVQNNADAVVNDVTLLLQVCNFVYAPDAGSDLTWTLAANVQQYQTQTAHVVISSLAAHTTRMISMTGGWYVQSSGPYTAVLSTTYVNSSPAMLVPPAAAVHDVTVTSPPPPPQSTEAPTTILPPDATYPPPAQVFVPGPLPAANWNETATSTVSISSAALNVVTQGGDNNYLRQHYYSDAARYISPAQAQAGSGSQPAWTFNASDYRNAVQIQAAWDNADANNQPYFERFWHQPLIWNNYVVMGGDMNSLFVLNADSGALVSHLYLGRLTYAYQSIVNCLNGVKCSDEQLVGMSSTPVVDLNTNILYVIHKTYLTETGDPLNVDQMTFKLHALSLPNLTEQPGWPVDINNLQYRNVTFAAGYQQSRPALTLMNGVVYVGFGSLCDVGYYRGWLVGVSIRTAAVVQLWAPALWGQGAGLWGTGTGPSSDYNSRLFLTTGNDFSKVSDVTFPSGNTPDWQDLPIPHNTPNWATLGNSIIRFDIGTLTPQQFFTPFNSADMDNDDQDVGSSGFSILPASWGTPAHAKLGIAGGKNGSLYLLDMDNMGGFAMGYNGGDAIVFEIKLEAYASDGRYVGLLNSLSINVVDHIIYAAVPGEKLRAYKYSKPNNQPQLTRIGVSDVSVPTSATQPFGWLGGHPSTPLVLTNGNTGAAVVWFTHSAGLWAYSGIPDSNGILQALAYVAMDDAQNYHMPAFHKGGVITGSTRGIIRKWQFA